MNELTIDYFRYYTALITSDELLLLKRIFEKYSDEVPFELTMTAEEFLSGERDNYKRLFIAVNNLYSKYVNFANKDYGFQIRWLQKVETDLDRGLVRLQWSDDIYKHLDLLRNMLTQYSD